MLEGFVCFCSSKGLASKSISGCINGLKHFASDLEDGGGSDVGRAGEVGETL